MGVNVGTGVNVGVAVAVGDGVGVNVKVGLGDGLIVTLGVMLPVIEGVVEIVGVTLVVTRTVGVVV